MNELPGVRPGGSAVVTPEGIVCGTDAKYRWALEISGLRRRCLLFTLDKSRISRSRVKGRATADEVTHAFAVWVGGRTEPTCPALRPAQNTGAKRRAPHHPQPRPQSDPPQGRVEPFLHSRQPTATRPHSGLFAPKLPSGNHPITIPPTKKRRMSRFSCSSGVFRLLSDFSCGTVRYRLHPAPAPSDPPVPCGWPQ